MRSLLSFAIASLLALPAAADVVPEPPTTTITVLLQPAKPAGKRTVEATAVFMGRCVVCHGPAGAGDGVAAMGMQPKPRAFANLDWQKSVTDAHLLKAIREGGAAVGKSPLMPANPDLSPEIAAELVRLIRGQRYAKVHLELAPKRGASLIFDGLVNVDRTFQLKNVPLGEAKIALFIDVDGDGKRGKKEPGLARVVVIDGETLTLTLPPK